EKHIGPDVDVAAIAFHGAGDDLAAIEDDIAGIDGDITGIAGAALHGGGDLALDQFDDLASGEVDLAPARVQRASAHRTILAAERLLGLNGDVAGIDYPGATS